MRIDRFAIAAAAIAASTVVISCSSDNNTPANNTIGVSGSVPTADTSGVVVDTTTP